MYMTVCVRTSFEVCTSFKDFADDTLTDGGGREELANSVHFDSLGPLVVLTEEPIKVYLRPRLKYNYRRR